ncbi:MAG: hypothetical protein JWP02_2518 [Acidimicrobiales bacterium]|nr:hypothetical protein [Acidimicrobiales bacterium]
MAPVPPPRPSSPGSAPACVTAPADTADADVDGDGCDEPVAFDAGVLLAGGRRMSVGEPGDAMAVGRWNCRLTTVALLRPRTGEVFRFDGWASAGRPVEPVRVATVEGAVDVHALAGPRAGCDDIAVARSTGPPVVVWRAP